MRSIFRLCLKQKIILKCFKHPQSQSVFQSFGSDCKLISQLILYIIILTQKTRLTYITNRQQKFIMYSNLNIRTQITTKPPNLLENMFNSLVGELSDQYPELCKYVFMCLLLNTSACIYSNQPDQIRDIYSRICCRLGWKEKVYHCDNHTFSQDIFKNKEATPFYLLVGVMSINNKKKNELAEYIKENLIINIEVNSLESSGGFLTKEFGVTFIDDSQPNFSEFLNTIQDKKLNNTVAPKTFWEMAGKAKKLAEEMPQSGFMKVYYQYLKIRLQKDGITYPHSRWKKTFEYLKVVGLNREPSEFKFISLADCILTPWFLSTSPSESMKISQANKEIILSMCPYFGTVKFQKHLSAHFWISPSLKKAYLCQLPVLVNRVSFFFPCWKYHNKVILELETSENQAQNDTSFHYRVEGCRKLMSDKYIPVNQKKQYLMSMAVRASKDISIQFGVVCYDIHRHNSCEKGDEFRQGSQIIVSSASSKEIFGDESSKGNLANWNVFQEQSDISTRYAYLYSIALFNPEDKEASYVLSGPDPFSTAQQNCAYIKIDSQRNSIILSPAMAETMRSLISSGVIIYNKMRAVNYTKPPESLLQTLKVGIEWTKTQAKYWFESPKAGNRFPTDTESIRIVVIIEPNKLDSQKEETLFYFKDIEFSQITTNMQ